MAFKLAPWVMETTLTTGTSDFSLAGAVANYLTFSSFMSNNDTTYYVAINGADREEGIGTWVTGGTLQRTTVLASTNGGSKVSFSAGARVFVDVPAGQWLHRKNGVAVDAAQTLTATEQAQGRSNLSAALKGHIHGLTLSNNGSDTTNDIDIAAGEAASTETNPVLMVLAAALTKRLDAAWAVGTGNGGLDTGSIANTTYHVWLIQRSDTGVVDALFSTSASSPTMPANYDRKRRIGSIIRSGGAIRAFTQNGDEFLLSTAVNTYNSGSPGTGAVLVAMDVPTGIVVEAIVDWVIHNGENTQGFFYLSDPAVNAITPDTSLSTSGKVADSTSGRSQQAGGRNSYRTDTSGRIRRNWQGPSTANVLLYLWTAGWRDRRGRDA